MFCSIVVQISIICKLEFPANSAPITNVSIKNSDDSNKNNVAPNSSTPKPLSANATLLLYHECDCFLSRRISPIPHKIPGEVCVPTDTSHFKMIKRASKKEI